MAIQPPAAMCTEKKRLVREVGSYHALFSIPEQWNICTIVDVLQKRETVNEVNTRH